MEGQLVERQRNDLRLGVNRTGIFPGRGAVT